MLKRVLIVLIAAVAMGVGAVGDKPISREFKLPQSRAAKMKYDNAMKKAYEVWRLAAMAADKQYILDLDEAKKAAMRSTNLEEANRVAAVTQDIDTHFRDLLKGPNPHNSTIVKVYAEKEWQPVIKVKKDQKLKIVVAGKWNINTKQTNGLCGPEGRQDGFGKLMGKLNDEGDFVVGAGCEWIADADGVLSMVCYDPLKFDNTGYVTVEITNPDASSAATSDLPAPKEAE